MRNVLIENNISTKSTDLGTETEHWFDSRYLSRGTCLLTINSEANHRGAEEACRRVLRACDSKRHVYVFDQSSDDRLRNWILQDQANYINFARQLEPLAMLSALNLRED